ncbi:uncharacterized protein [Magallana gigas]|uniref:uncharacterized protein isoform X4 n=1 Tax=Magallana gigas TaxID=29159 RepID=UPI0033405495
MELFLSSIFTCVSFLVVSTAGVNVHVTTTGCTVFIQWNKETHSEVYIDIRNAKDKDNLGIETSRGRFTYADVQPGQSYNITWTPIRRRNNKREREVDLKEENYVSIPRDCNIQTSSSSEISTPKTDSILQQSSSEISPTQETDSSGFCDVYFWVSVFAFPVVIGAVIVLTYLHIIRKFEGTKRRKQNDPQSARSAGVNVKSTCYSNNTPHYYDEVQYSLAQEIER